MKQAPVSRVFESDSKRADPPTRNERLSRGGLRNTALKGGIADVREVHGAFSRVLDRENARRVPRAAPKVCEGKWNVNGRRPLR